VTIRHRLEEDLQVRREKSQCGISRLFFFFTTNFGPTSLAAGGGVSPGCKLVPLVSRRSRCVAGLEMCFATQAF